MLAPIEWHTLLCSHFFFLVILKCYTMSISLYEKEWKCHFRYLDQICHFKHLFEHCIITLYFQDKHQCAIQKYKEALDEDFSFMLPLFMISIEYRSLNLTAAELESLNLMVTVCIYLDHISSVIVRMFALNVVDHGLKPQSGQIKDFENCYLLSLRYAHSIKEQKQRLSLWIRIMCLSEVTCLGHGLLFQSASNMKFKLSVLV